MGNRDVQSRFLEQIERLAPAAYREERRGLLADLDRLPPGVGREVLIQFWVIYQLEYNPTVQREQHVEECDARLYWRARDRLGGMLQEIEEHPLVRSFPGHEVEFYEPGEFRCPHGRHRKACETIRKRLELYRFLEGRIVTRYLPGRESGLREELRKAGVDPAVRDPQEFCEALPADPLTPAAEARPASRARGRPRDEVRNQQIRLVVEGLVAAGVSVAEACALLQRMLSTCCGQETDAETLERQYRRLNESGSPPSNSKARRS
jgi:hypothetical protein